MNTLQAQQAINEEFDYMEDMLELDLYELETNNKYFDKVLEK